MFHDENTWLIDLVAKSLHSRARKVGPIIVLFDPAVAAQSVAFMLKAKWDGCNSISIAVFDDEAIETAASLQKAEFCYFGDCCIFLT